MRPPSPRSLRCAVIPFGSQANGQHHSASDTDAAVITLTETWAGPAAADAVQRRFDRFKQYPRHRLTKRPGGLDSAGASHTTPFFEFHHDHNPKARSCPSEQSSSSSSPASARYRRHRRMRAGLARTCTPLRKRRSPTYSTGKTRSTNSEPEAMARSGSRTCTRPAIPTALSSQDSRPKKNCN